MGAHRSSILAERRVIHGKITRFFCGQSRGRAIISPMTEVVRMVLGIAGGSGSGKSWLAQLVADAFPGKASILSHEWYNKHQARLAEIDRRKLYFDHPSALETGLLCRHLDALREGQVIDAPRYDYSRHA